MLLSTISAFSQIPSYYNDVNLNQSNTALKNALATKVISTQTTSLSYTPGVWNALKQSDLDLSDTNSVVLIYGYNNNDNNYVTDKTRSKDANGGSAGTQWNREHVYPKSLGNPNLGTSGAGADVHNLRPADISFNSQRSSKKFADGSGNAGDVSGGWYPGDEWKGDVARMMMYMYIRYGNQCLPSNVAIGATNSSDNNMIQLLLEWNAEDPVSDFEKQRNPIIQNLQGNRNPFIDNPAFATQIWGGPQAEDLFGNGGSSNPDSNTNVTDLLISEYIEGSSNNKALEIANFTGETINLSGYSLKKASNGASWTNTVNLSGQLENGNVYVIANNNASTIIKNKAQLTETSVSSFNGNDAIGLFKGSTLIDLIGNPNSSSTFAQNKTLQRKSTVSSPNSNYTISEWTVLSKDTFSGLGNHTIDGGTPPPPVDTTAPSSPSNLSTSNITETSVNLSWNASTDNTAVTGYDVYKGSAKIASVTTTNYSVSGLTAATNYTFNIRAKDAAGNISTSSNTIGVTTKSVVVTYCTSKGNNSSYEYIDNVAIGGISNVSSSNNGYGDFTAQTGNISFGNNTIILSAGFSGSSYTEFWKVWIDFNKNGVFESNEEVVSGSSSSSANLSARFTVPTSALTGKTRMRVAMKWDAAPSACETFAYGEVEDYSVNIGVSAKGGNNTNVIAETKLGNETAVFNAILSPNPTTDYLKIEMADKRDANYTIVNVIGQKVLNGKVNHSTINVSNLENGMYILKINDGQRAFTKKFIKK